MLIGPYKNKPQWNFNRNASTVVEGNTFENFVCEMLCISSRTQCVTIVISYLQKQSRLVHYRNSRLQWTWVKEINLGFQWKIIWHAIPEYTENSRINIIKWLKLIYTKNIFRWINDIVYRKSLTIVSQLKGNHYICVNKVINHVRNIRSW